MTVTPENYDFAAAVADWAQVRPGWVGSFTTTRAPGALETGTRITKTNSEAGDGTPDGTGGTVLGSIWAPQQGVAYFVEWDDKPKIAVMVIALKLLAAKGSA